MEEQERQQEQRRRLQHRKDPRARLPSSPAAAPESGRGNRTDHLRREPTNISPEEDARVTEAEKAFR
jgi:hypothetical protein